MFAAWRLGGRRHQLLPPSRLVATCGDRTLPRERLVPLAQPDPTRTPRSHRVPALPPLRLHLVSPGRSPAPSTAPLAAQLGTLPDSRRGTPPGRRQIHQQRPTLALAASKHADALARCQESRAPRHSSRTRAQLNVFWRGYWLLTDHHRRGKSRRTNRLRTPYTAARIRRSPQVHSRFPPYARKTTSALSPTRQSHLRATGSEPGPTC